MAKGRGILLAGLAAGAYAYFKKPENREKATVAFNNAKLKVNSFMESQNLDNLNEKDTEQSASKQKNEQSVQYYNEKTKDEDQNENTKLSPNDTSEEKSENTETVAPEPRIGTENL